MTSYEFVVRGELGDRFGVLFEACAWSAPAG
jgi:hypothetical protein